MVRTADLNRVRVAEQLEEVRPPVVPVRSKVRNDELAVPDQRAQFGRAVLPLTGVVVEADLVARDVLVTRPFRINYVPATEMAGTLDPLKSERGRITSNASTNTLIVTDVG